MTIAPNRKWLPSAWMDEMPPEQAARPEQFFTRDPHYGIRVVPLEVQRAGNDSNLHGIIFSVQNGDSVPFQYVEDRGNAALTVYEDGNWDCEPEIGGAGCLYWLPYDGDTICESLEDLVANSVELTEPGTHDVAAYFWSEEIELRVEVLESGDVRLQGPAGFIVG